MDKLEKRLKQDASAIDAEVPASLRRRIDANLASAVQQKATVAPRRPAAWLSVAVAAGVALLAVIVLRGNDRPAAVTAPGEVVEFAATPSYAPQQGSPLSLQVQPVKVTEPLEHELLSLRADFEKVRETIELDLRSTL